MSLLSAVDAEVPRTRQPDEQFGSSSSDFPLVLWSASSSSLGVAVIEPAVVSVLALPLFEVAALLVDSPLVLATARPVALILVSVLLASLFGIASSGVALLPLADVPPTAPVAVGAFASQVELANLLRHVCAESLVIRDIRDVHDVGMSDRFLRGHDAVVETPPGCWWFLC